jgi:hypothetical protein
VVQAGLQGFLYADHDGILLAPGNLLQQPGPENANGPSVTGRSRK